MKLYKTSCNFIHTNLGFFKLMETIETFTFFFFPSFFLSFFLFYEYRRVLFCWVKILSEYISFVGKFSMTAVK